MSAEFPKLQMPETPKRKSEVKVLDQKQAPPGSEKSLDLETLVENLDGFECSITNELMRNPLMAADGHSYEAEAIKAWLQGGRRISPMTGASLPHLLLTPNHNLRQAIEHFLRQRPEYARLKELERAQKSQQQVMEDLQMAIALREKDLQERLQKEQKTVSASVSSLSARFGMMALGSQQAQQRLGEAVLGLTAAIQAYLPSINLPFDPNAAASYAATVVSLFSKEEVALKAFLDNPEGHSIPKPVATVIAGYLTQHPELHQLRDYPDLAHDLKRQLAAGKLAELQKRFEPRGEDKSAAVVPNSQPAVVLQSGAAAPR